MLADVPLQSRFLLGTAGYPSPRVLREAITASGAQVVTLGLKRQLAATGADNGFIDIIRASGAQLLPNTAGCRTAREAITLAHMARELRWAIEAGRLGHLSGLLAPQDMAVASTPVSGRPFDL